MSQPKILQRAYQGLALSQLDGVPRPPLTTILPAKYTIVDLRTASNQIYTIAPGKWNWFRVTAVGQGGGGGGGASFSNGGGGGGLAQSDWLYLGGATLAIKYTVGAGMIGVNTRTNLTATVDTVASFSLNGVPYTLTGGGGLGSLVAGVAAAGGIGSGGLINFTGGSGVGAGGAGAAGTTSNGGDSSASPTGNGGGGGQNGSGTGGCGGGGVAAPGGNSSSAGIPVTWLWGASPASASSLGGDWGGGGAATTGVAGAGNAGGVRIELS